MPTSDIDLSGATLRTGTDGDDTLTAAPEGETLLGGLGNDVLQGGPGDDLLVGGSGDDTIDGGAGNDTIVGDGPDSAAQDGIRITFVGEEAGFRNTLGVYSVDPETGVISNVQIAFPNASLPGSGGDLPAGSTFDYAAPDGAQIGVFLIADGASLNDFAALGPGSFAFRNADGTPATLSSVNPQLVFVGADGTEVVLRGQTYHSAGFGENAALNADGLLHTQGFGENPDGSVTIGFEDLPGLGDRDFDDTIFTFALGDAQNTLLNAHYDLVPVPQPEPAAGNDLLGGGEGDDVIFGGAGDDTVFGGAGDDRIDLGPGDDVGFGDAGDDTISGGAGDDVAFGGSGDDRIDLGPGDDVGFGDSGDDTIDGGAGDDTIFGGSGDDNLIGGAGDNQIFGGTGNDTIVGSTDGDDTIFGGDDRDVIQVANPNASSTVFGGSGGDDFDVLDVTSLTGLTRSQWRLANQVEDSDGNGFDGEIELLDSDGNVTGRVVFENIEKIIPCFTPGTLIATPRGERPIEDLKAGDKVITRDNGIQEIRWIGR
ncbi:MAG: Hint domain-containing protein, partial [Gemmobacter sp.]